MSLNAQILAQKAQLLYLKRQISGPIGIYNKIIIEEVKCQEGLNGINLSLDSQRKVYISILTDKTKQALDTHLQDKSKEYIVEMEEEFQATDTTLATIEKQN